MPHNPPASAVTPVATQATGQLQAVTVKYAGQEWTVQLKSYCSPEFVAALAVERGLGLFSDHNPTLERERLRQVAARPDGNVCLAYTEDGFIVGYVAFYRPEPDNRWGRARLAELYELGAVEVSRNWRGTGLGKALLRFSSLDPSFESRIIISQEFSWHWDLHSANLDAAAYRSRLMAVMAAGGYTLYHTTEPNIAFYPHNFFMARLGSCVSPSARARFEDLLLDGDDGDNFFDQQGF